MPVDYSRFDHIEDSDEEPATKTSSVAATTAAAAASSAARLLPAGIAEARNGGGRNSNSGRELLEPRGLEDRLRLVSAPTSGPPPPGAGRGGGGGGERQQGASDPMLQLAEQLERWAGPRGGDGAGAGAAGGDGPEAPKPGEPQRVCVKSEGKKKIHTTFPDGSEMVEEFDEKTDILLLRKSRRPTKLGKEGEWVFEVGQAPPPAFDPHADLLRASSSNPIFLRKDTPEHFQWRIRNLPYPADVYSVTVDQEKQEIVVRTSNKKYFKRFQVPDLFRLNMKLRDEMLTWKHQHNTLIISYIKPAEVVAAEQKLLKEAEKSALKM